MQSNAFCCLLIDETVANYYCQARKMQEKGWKPRWFDKDKDSNTYRYVGGYWEARAAGNWESCPDIFGQLPTDTEIDHSP